MITAFLIKYWELVVIFFLVANTVVQKLKWKGGADLLAIIKDGIVSLFKAKPGVLPLLLGFLLMSFLFVGFVHAEPFLKAGATLNCTKWQIDLDGVVIDVPVAVSDDPRTVWMEYDLAEVSEGTHLVKVRAGNKWGMWSDWYPLEFTKTMVDVVVPPFIE